MHTSKKKFSNTPVPFLKVYFYSLLEYTFEPVIYFFFYSSKVHGGTHDERLCSVYLVASSAAWRKK